MTLHEIASKYLKASVFQKDHLPYLEERLHCDYLWERIKQLHAESETELNKTWLYKYLVPILEFRFGEPSPDRDPLGFILIDGRTTMLRKERRETIFEFSRGEFQVRWPKILEERERSSQEINKGVNPKFPNTLQYPPEKILMANKAMVEAALAQQHSQA